MKLTRVEPPELKEIKISKMSVAFVLLEVETSVGFKMDCED